MPVEAQAVLGFWFGAGPERGKRRAEWFRKDDAFDRRLRADFGALHARAAARELDAWRADPRAMLALVVLLDQFSRNLYRDDARAFAQDAYARECASEALARGDDLAMLPVERQFLYLPFEHAEDHADQERAVVLMAPLEAFPETRGVLDWAERHRAVIRRFGRFPHRNLALGRAPTAEEQRFLAQPGSRF